MEKLSMCRICLSDDIPLRSLVDTHLEKMYEALTMMSLVAEDSRPSLACDLCCSRLEAFYDLRRQSLRSEELFTQLLRHKVQVNLQVMLDMHLSRYLRTAKFLDYDDIKQEDTEDDTLVEQDDADPYHSALGLHTECDIPLDVVKEETSDDYTDDAAVEQDDANPYHSAPSVVKEESDDSDTPLLALRKYSKVTLLNNLKRTDIEERKRETRRDVKDESVEKNKMVETSDKMSKIILSADQSTDTNSSSSNNIKQFLCDTCQKCFKCKSNLRRHLLRHIVEKPYKCKICKRRFRLMNTLNMHFQIHIDEKPYECDICQKRFTSKSCVKSHVRIHLKKRYECNICKRSFARENTFDIHMRIHTRVRNIISVMYPNKTFFT